MRGRSGRRAAGPCGVATKSGHAVRVPADWSMVRFARATWSPGVAIAECPLESVLLPPHIRQRRRVLRQQKRIGPLLIAKSRWDRRLTGGALLVRLCRARRRRLVVRGDG